MYKTPYTKNREEEYFRTGEATTSGREKMREWRSKGGQLVAESE